MLKGIWDIPGEETVTADPMALALLGLNNHRQLVKDGKSGRIIIAEQVGRTAESLFMIRSRVLRLRNCARRLIVRTTDSAQ